MKIIFKSVYYLTLAVLASIAVLLVASLLPIPGNYKVKVVLSGSMEPTIKTGSIIVARPASDYAKGDIITFGRDTQKEIPVTHRIVGEKNGAFVTRGDANDIADTNLVQKRDIIGKVFFTVPYAGFAVSAAKTPLGFIFLILLPALIIIFDEVRKIGQEIMRMRSGRIKKIPRAPQARPKEHPVRDVEPPRRRMIV